MRPFKACNPIPYRTIMKNQTLEGFAAAGCSPPQYPSRHYCGKHKPDKPIVLPGGTWCSYHREELCRVLRYHCKVCGEWLETEEEFGRRIR